MRRWSLVDSVGAALLTPFQFLGCFDVLLDVKKLVNVLYFLADSVKSSFPCRSDFDIFTYLVTFKQQAPWIITENIRFI